jgi:hypothetical protein
LAIHKKSADPKGSASLVRQNVRIAKSLWANELSVSRLSQLRTLSRLSGLALAAGELLLLDGRWYVTSGGLLRLAKDNGCRGIHTHAIEKLSIPQDGRWVFKATVYKTTGSKGFVGYGDADPSNVSLLVRGAEMRVAETRAVNRALRKAYGIGLCSVEELSWPSGPAKPADASRNSNGFRASNGSNGSPSRLRDQLCLLIRQYNLDPILVKAYAAHFCGTETLKEAGRDLVESFISHIASSAKEDIDGLICKLNSYSRPVEVKE